jgi:predicted acetyltransferase
MVDLVRPARAHLPGYVAALRSGWSPDNVRGRVTAEAQLAAIERDPAGFLDGMDYRDTRGATVELPDGSHVPRLPGFTRWIWADGMAGSINLRWQEGTSALPPHLLGHVGYAVVPWLRGRGIGTRALALLLPLARAEGLDRMELTTDPDNPASRRLIERNGGVFLGEFDKGPQYGGGRSLRFEIRL